jgi:pimeloyl-ACP methyl ester carboxylesterase
MELVMPDFRMIFEDHGSGLPLLLIHGFPLNRQIWRPQIEGLSDHVHVIAPDLRGHGETPPTEGIASMDLLADDCLLVLDALGIDRPAVVCGLSMGGYVTLAFHRRHRDRVAGLILVSTRAGADSAEAKANRDRLASQVKDEGPQAAAIAMLPKMLSPKTYDSNPDLVKQVAEIMNRTSPEGIVAALMGMKERPDSTPFLDQISVPTLIVHGADDQIIPTGEAEAMHAAIKNSRLEIIPDAGHLLNMEQPTSFNRVVLEFLADLQISG